MPASTSLESFSPRTFWAQLFKHVHLFFFSPKAQNRSWICCRCSWVNLVEQDLWHLLLQEFFIVLAFISPFRPEPCLPSARNLFARLSIQFSELILLFLERMILGGVVTELLFRKNFWPKSLFKLSTSGRFD